MSVCKRCWSIAYLRTRVRGGMQADHYRDLLAEHPEGRRAEPTPALPVTHQEAER